VARDDFVDRLVSVARRNSIPYFSAKPSGRGWHRQAGQRGEQRRDADVLVALAELLDRGLLVRVVRKLT
jgi:hypothetical protein